MAAKKRSSRSAKRSSLQFRRKSRPQKRNARLEKGWTQIAVQVAFESQDLRPAEDIAALTLSFQLAYDAICEGFGYPKTAIRLLSVDYPNMSINLAGLTDAVKALESLIKSLPQAIVDLITIGGAIKVKRAKLSRQLIEEKTRLLEAERRLRDTEARGDGARTEAERAHVEAALARVRLANERRKVAVVGMQPDMKKIGAIRSAARETRDSPKDVRSQLFVEGVRYRVVVPTTASIARMSAEIIDEDMKVGTQRGSPSKASRPLRRQTRAPGLSGGAATTRT
jgi:hypothetical protein